SSRKARRRSSSSRRARPSTSCRNPGKRPIGSSMSVSTLISETKSAGHPDMVWVAGGTFLMGSNAFYREERPVRPQTVQGFWLDRFPVTNAAFANFVAATGYVTACERSPDPAMYPDADPALLVPGSAVFCKPMGPVSLRDSRAWWEYVPGADWRHP